ncbi:MAG: glycine oxidase ThiO [Candidatus Omnitrophica bacterium]|nr:glycine oxidase ThiO [Candidatus Omnitrophota bacterium]
MPYDAIVLGGGIIGTALAEELARRGQRIAVVERGTVGSEASNAAAGILAAQVDLPAPGPLFEFCRAARRMYPRWVEHLERRSGICVGFHVDGILHLVLSGREEQAMKRQARWQRAQGVRVDQWSPKEVRRHEPVIDGKIRGGFHFPMEAQVDNVRLMEALAAACRKAGVSLQERTAVRRLVVRDRTVRGVETDRGALEAPVVVNCLGSWADLGDTFPLRLPVEPVRGQMLAFLGPKRLVRHAVMSSGAYVVQRRDGRLVVGSTLERAGFHKALTLEGIHAILCGLRKLSRAFDQCALIDSWAGLRPLTTTDKLPILGRTPVEGLYVATGHFRHGILLAPTTAQAMAELILRGRSAFDLTPFSPLRFQPQ